ncbi:MAG: MerR family transcriptional regulator, partial [Leucobacter sp.]|nr:MerR family transcriptional regulator [Leucobacter sp.]
MESFVSTPTAAPLRAGSLSGNAVHEPLFHDGMPELDIESGYKGAIAARAAGISYRQLDYWARTGLVEPTIRSAQGSGSQRLYGFRDILVLKLVKR